ncbi:MAG: beta-ketoacyl-ACP synthase II [Oscillospiraceae bacterium]
MKRRVVITGMGALCPIGNNVEDMWEAAKVGTCGIDEITKFDTANHKVKLAGEIKNLDATEFIDKKDLRRMAKYTQLALIAAKEAMKQSEIKIENENPLRCGVNVSSGIGGLDMIEQEHSRGLEKGFDRVSPFFIPTAISNMAAGTIAIEFGFKGSCICVVTACASGTNAVGESFRQIRDNYSDVMICGGTEASITPLGIGGFTAMKALSESTDKTRASIPFDKERNGFVMAEGAGILVLEEYEHAIKRGATIIGEVVGYATNCDANHITAPMEDGSGASDCMLLAISDADLDKKDIGYINAHGTSTSLNDKYETTAIKRTFGDYANNILVSSTKSMTGHMLGATGAVEAIFTVKSLENGFVLPTIGYKVKDENCDLDIVPNVGRKADIEYAMSNSLGFGGHNASVIFKKV